MTQADKYFGKNGRYSERLNFLFEELSCTITKEEINSKLLKFGENTKLHLATFKLTESDLQYVNMVSYEYIVEKFGEYMRGLK